VGLPPQAEKNLAGGVFRDARIADPTQDEAIDSRVMPRDKTCIASRLPAATRVTSTSSDVPWPARAGGTA